ncbi:MAG: bifunctional adenosylcobinamide kinase/adenosylcobinamide-phosphate guanylyltransferase [Deltaproteobacteria bacterium]|nr:bifunctional adenosylcobinamide kinase/adenosylcobinamide-phosphate guanylyltransferase [Deltaproteobacteria bacterium]MBW2020146.1 bifunctional adenosylcobinamide kinase/adenosylcobinamide-phosphate guanylyltransferase [Deltaproteobacteria bacterium]MBW2075061.1 bifunctional adenosylcobinamide kinase/adenosylcobinamide-phosphate guanylyltransferase [Deltaproteobacteria bacterium]RLB81638.1 MAG: bifunctional adenosylcobinamide kinase/adenosylcobinamide-phosphate guanylyltransferase [Deltaprot
MKEIVFITGGCRSGKSKFALAFADRHFERKVFMATCCVQDEEMRQRIKEHQKARGSDWQTVEVSTALSEAVASHSRHADVILIDCLTLWVSNLLADGASQEQILVRTDALTQAIEEATCSVILVSNEVGTGIVPENALARRFRDVAGLVNQKVAACADSVVWMVAGIPVFVKGVPNGREKL